MAGTESRWTGGLSPFGMSWQKLMMWWFIVTDALLFAGFLGGYGFSRLGSSNWPRVEEFFSLSYLTVMTFVLISSSATMACAVAAAKAGDRVAVARFTGLTTAGGILFLGMQAYEWAHFISAGGRPWSNPHGDARFGSYFFLVTGFHGTHVLIGVLILFVATLRARAGRFTGNGIEVAGLYWHFVDLVWVFIFGCFYLI
ncbi:MAG TPA: cytochrome c oxidase subunit 3 [Planctomycetota bacterium]|nr:cytochrome c oxidase subunit 3 [Planctomycetota bacterium]